MGRKRVDENEKKVRVTISIKRKNINELRESNVNMSALIENFISEWLKNNKKK